MGQVALAWISVAAAVGGTAASVHQSNVAQKREKRAQRLKQRQDAVANNRRIRQALADSRLAQAQVINAGQAQIGGFDSSGLAGGVGSAQTQVASNIGFSRQTTAFNSAIGGQLQSANRARSNAQTFGQIAQLPTAFGRDFGTDVATAKNSITG
jgi:hypothetical protein